MNLVVSHYAQSLSNAIARSSEHLHLIDIMGSVEAFQDLVSFVVPALCRTLIQRTGECPHLMSLKDDEFRLKRHAGLNGNSAWKDRARDRKGQLYRVCMDKGRLMGWSAHMQTWVIIIPQSLQSVMAQWLKSFYEQYGDSQTQLAFAKYQESLGRNYADTVGQRAEKRGCAVHRRHLDGRRNHFVKVPKPLY